MPEWLIVALIVAGGIAVLIIIVVLLVALIAVLRAAYKFIMETWNETDDDDTYLPPRTRL